MSHDLTGLECHVGQVWNVMWVNLLQRNDKGCRMNRRCSIHAASPSFYLI